MPDLYKHGTYGEFAKTISSVPENSVTIPVYIGTAPINLVQNGKNLVNMPIKISNMVDAQNKLGYSDDWETFTLCEAMKAHFDNPIGNVGPVVFINVLDPSTHKGTAITKDVTFKNGKAYIVSDKIIIDTLTITGSTDHQLVYDYNLKRLTILSDKLDGDVSVTYNEVDTTDIDEDTIIGVKTDTGIYQGLGAVELVYTELNMIPNIIAAPGWSQIKEVYVAMVSEAENINGHWKAVVNADIPIANVGTMDAAIQWKETNAYTEETSKVCWPKWKADTGEIYHISTLVTWEMQIVDTANGGIPMESVSNKQIPYGQLYFGESSTNKGYDQQQANKLNAKGITTATFWGGQNVLWGPHTAAYDFEGNTDKRAIFENSIRMMMYIANSFQADWGLTIDKPMTLSLAETIRVKEQEKVDALKAVGALIGDPAVEFVASDNPIDNLVNGDFMWRNRVTATPSFKSGTMKVAYTTEGFNAYLGGEE